MFSSSLSEGASGTMYCGVLTFKAYFPFWKWHPNEIYTCPACQGPGSQVDSVSDLNDLTAWKWSFCFKGKYLGYLNDFQIICSKVLSVSKYFWMSYTNFKLVIALFVVSDFTYILDLAFSLFFYCLLIQLHEYVQIKSRQSLEMQHIAAKSLQSSPTLCDPIDGSPPGSPIPGILQARTLEWVAIS